VPGAIRPTSLASSNRRARPSRNGSDVDRVEGRREVKPPTAGPDLIMTERDERARLGRENRPSRLERDVCARDAWFARETRLLVGIVRFMRADWAALPIAALARVRGV
jgi:transposase